MIICPGSLQIYAQFKVIFREKKKKEEGKTLSWMIAMAFSFTGGVKYKY